MKRAKEYFVPVSKERLRAILLDLPLYGEYHPLIRKVITTTRSNHYKINEQPYPNLPFRVNYSVTLSEEGGNIYYKLTDIPFWLARLSYHFSEDTSDLTKVIFSVDITGKMPGKTILMNKMMRAQDRLMKKIQDLNENDLVNF